MLSLLAKLLGIFLLLDLNLQKSGLLLDIDGLQRGGVCRVFLFNTCRLATLAREGKTSNETYSLHYIS